MDKVLFTSESVTEGHPDKMCDVRLEQQQESLWSWERYLQKHM